MSQPSYDMTQVADFAVHYLQFIDDQANATQTLPPFANVETLKTLYQQMVFTRTVDRKAVNLQRTGKLGTYPPSTGQEAVSVGIGHAMKADDVFCPYYRDQGTLLLRGVRVEDIYNYWGGNEEGSLIPEAVNAHDFPVSIPIASQFQHAVGIGYAMTYKKENHAVVVTGGEGSTSEGDFYEAINLAGTHQLPVVFVINNNQWAISVPRSAQTGTQTIAQKAIAAGFTGLQVDGNDVVAVRTAVADALEKARQGQGPTLIEAITYRLCDHTTADDFSRYADDHLEPAWDKEPIARLKRYLMSEGHWKESDEAAMKTRIDAEIQTAADTYLSTPKATKENLFKHLFAELPKSLHGQRQLAMEEN